MRAEGLVVNPSPHSKCFITGMQSMLASRLGRYFHGMIWQNSSLGRVGPRKVNTQKPRTLFLFLLTRTLAWVWPLYARHSTKNRASSTDGLRSPPSSQSPTNRKQQSKPTHPNHLIRSTIFVNFAFKYKIRVHDPVPANMFPIYPLASYDPSPDRIKAPEIPCHFTSKSVALLDTNRTDRLTGPARWWIWIHRLIHTRWSPCWKTRRPCWRPKTL
ncbi:hypothetical protein DFS34DRAFT_188571 [Phlyctochytrium arcticum]|nr:hypothetical protein DFS34DRAFT_188571 [Phlyctochytrium arcticum]